MRNSWTLPSTLSAVQVPEINRVWFCQLISHTKAIQTPPLCNSHNRTISRSINFLHLSMPDVVLSSRFLKSRQVCIVFRLSGIRGQGPALASKIMATVTIYVNVSPLLHQLLTGYGKS